jgi:hypothetical protein
MMPTTPSFRLCTDIALVTFPMNDMMGDDSWCVDKFYVKTLEVHLVRLDVESSL